VFVCVLFGEGPGSESGRVSLGTRACSLGTRACSGELGRVKACFAILDSKFLFPISSFLVSFLFSFPYL